MDNDCKNCRHYGFYEMITSGRPYGYAGEIPCLRCSRFRWTEDNFEPKATTDTFVLPEDVQSTFTYPCNVGDE